MSQEILTLKMATYSLRGLLENINSIVQFCEYQEVLEIFCENELLSLEIIEEIEVNLESIKL